MSEDNSNGTLTRSFPLLLIAIVAFFRPLISGLGVESFGQQVFGDAVLRAVPLLLLASAALAGYGEDELRAPAARGIALMLVAAIVAAAAGFNPFHSFEKVSALTGSMALAFCVATWARGDKARQELIVVMLFATAIVSIYGIYQYLSGFEKTVEYITNNADPWSGDNALKALKARRIFSTTFSPDMLAGILATVLPLALGAFGQSQRFNDRLAFALVILLAAIALYMTGSLGGWLAAAAGIGTFAIVLIRDRKIRIVATAAILLAMIALSAGILARRSETLLDLKHPENPFVQRLYFWEGGLKVAYHHPLLGVGPGNFGLGYLKVKSAAAEMSRYAHNHAINVLAETGPVGLAGWAFIVIAFLAGAWRKATLTGTARKPPPRSLDAGILAAGVAFLLHGLIDFDLEVPEVAGYFWILVGLSAGGEMEFAGDTGRSPKLNRNIRLMIGISALIFGLLSVAWLPGASYLQNGREALREKNNEVAAFELTRAIQFRPGDPAAIQERAKVWPPTREGKTLAFKDMKKAISYCPEDPFLWLAIGEFLFKEGAFNEALKAFMQASDGIPTWKVATAWVHLARAKVLTGEKRYSEAKEELYAVMRDFPGHPAATAGLEEIEELENTQKK